MEPNSVAAGRIVWVDIATLLAAAVDSSAMVLAWRHFLWEMVNTVVVYRTAMPCCRQ